MCGILGIINKSLKGIESSIINKMMLNINYRGPDDSGYVYFKNQNYNNLNINDSKKVYFDVLLSHNRLSIIDTSFNGHQPFSTSDLMDKYWIIFNGEVYNYIEIREELITLGYKFYTQTDTEVVLKAFVHWGDDAQNKFNGMWAIIIYNIDNESFWISRDRLGKKPLYYYEDSDYLIFSSEVKQLIPLVNLEENKLETEAILLTNYRGHLKETSFKNVYRFPPAHSLEISRHNTKFNFKKYWELYYDKNIVYEQVDKKKLENYSIEFYNIFYDAVKLRLRSDVPVGITLSGGLDSNSILHVMNSIINGSSKINTFSSIFDNPDLSGLDELGLINEALDGIQHEQHLVKTDYTDLEQFVKVYRDKTWTYDFPVPSIGFSGHSVYEKINAKGIKVVLEGQGADELLAGYDSYWFNFFQKFKIYKLMEAKNYLNSELNIKKLKYIIGGTVSNTIFSKYSYEYVYKKIMENRSKRIDINFSNELFEYMLYRDNMDKYSQIKEYNLNDALIDSLNSNLGYLLYTGDRDSMMFSIESRLPYLDYRLLEFVTSLPENYKMHNGFTKYISRVAFNNKLPNKVLWNKDKLGYPDATAYYVQKNKELKNLVIELLKNHNSSLNYEKMIDTDFRSVGHILSDIFFKEQFFGKKLEF